MHLTAKVPNEGARRLAWWLGNRPGDDALDRFAEAIGQHVGYIDRLLSGEVLPGGEVAHSVWLATGGAVWRFDWRTPARGGWFDEPAERTPSRRAA
jgi:hypothetical protein